MAKKQLTEINSPWQTRIQSANKFHGEWAGKFKCKLLDQYYEGFQWTQRKDYPTTNYNPYCINLFYSTIKIKLAQLLFQKPKFIISPCPGNSQWNQDFAAESAALKEDVLNTLVTQRAMNFTKHVKLAARDSFTRFGIIEVGYANDWRNPQKDEPYLKSWDDPEVTEQEDRVLEDNDLPINERFYVKRIRPTRFRVSVSEATDLNDHDWFGYYDYYYTRSLQHSEGIDWPSDYSGGNYISAEYTSDGLVGADREDVIKQLFFDGEISRVWHIWDMVKKKRLLLLDSLNMHELFSTDFTTHPFVDLRWDLRSSGFYPIPPTFHWISPQDEINESREQTRSYRRRFTRKFQAVKDTVTEEEKEKFAAGPDGIIIEVKQADAIKPIDNPEQGPTAENALVIARDDFNIISGTSADARGQSADRETATQAKIVDIRAQVRESAEQLDFAGFLCDVGRMILTQAQERLVTGLWIKMTSGPGLGTPDPSQPQAMQQFQSMQPVYNYITSEQLDDGYDYEVEFDVQNATPSAMQAEQQAFVNFLALCNNPLIMMSAHLIREAAYRVGYKNEAIIKEMQAVALTRAQLQMQEAQMQAQGQGQQGNNTANSAKSRTAQMATPTPDQLDTQLTNQLM